MAIKRFGGRKRRGAGATDTPLANGSKPKGGWKSKSPRGIEKKNGERDYS